MIKLKATKKQIKAANLPIISLGYCQAQNLLKYESPFAYSAGVYGWNCDYYEIDGVIISTGYRTIGQTLTYEFVQNFEKQASFADDKESHTLILKAFIKRAKEQLKE